MDLVDNDVTIILNISFRELNRGHYLGNTTQALLPLNHYFTISTFDEISLLTDRDLASINAKP